MIDRERYIKERIIPAMDVRRGRTSSLTTEEVIERLGRYPASGKPGEEHEMFREIVNAGESITVKLALEIADNVYYCLQPNAPENLIEHFRVSLEGVYGIEWDLMLDFCRIKYRTRLIYGDRTDHVKIEERIMNNFLNSLPESMVKLWPKIT